MAEKAKPGYTERMAKLDLDRIVEFEKLLHAFARVERTGLRIHGSDAKENAIEHSFFLAMLAWYVIDVTGLPLDLSRVIRYTLIHDLVEVYAGDTYILDTEAAKTKHEREEEAQRRIEKEFPEFEALHKTIHAYEAQGDEESRFVKALDKVEPVLSNYLQNGRGWKEMKVNFDWLVSHKRGKLAHHHGMRELFEEIIARIAPKKDEYFSETKL